MRTLAFWLMLLLVFVIPWENAIAIEDVATIGKGIGILVAAYWLFMVLVTGKFRSLRPFHLAVFLFVLWNGLSIFWTVDPRNTLLRAATYFQLVGLILILWDLCATPAALRAALQSYVFGAYITVYSVISNHFTGAAVLNSGGRATAAGFNANATGLLLTIGLPIAWHLATSESKGRIANLLRPINYAYVPLGVVGLLLTASRGGLISTAPVFLFILGSMTRLKLYVRVMLFVGLMLSLPLLQPLVPQSSIDRLSTTDDELTQGSLGERWELWLEGLAIFFEHPILGVGSNGYKTASTSGIVVHNTYLSILAETGVIGFTLFLLIFAIVIYQAIRLPKWEALFWLSILAVWVISVTAFAWEYRKATWLIFALLVANAHLQTEESQPVLAPQKSEPKSTRLLQGKPLEVVEAP